MTELIEFWILKNSANLANLLIIAPASMVDFLSYFQKKL